MAAQGRLFAALLLLVADPFAESECHFLGLPPELRNRIYELVFADVFETDLELDIWRIREYQPRIAIVLSCRQIYEEAIGLLRTAFETFGQQHIFYLQVNPAILTPERRRMLLDMLAPLPAGLGKVRFFKLRMTTETRDSTLHLRISAPKKVRTHLSMQEDEGWWTRVEYALTGIEHALDGHTLWRVANSKSIDIMQVVQLVCRELGHSHSGWRTKLLNST